MIPGTARSLPRIVLRSGPEPGRAYPIGDRLVLGRGEGVDVLLNDPTVSRRHSVVRREGDGFVIEDLASGNGTGVNGRRIAGALRLNPGDQIQLGCMLVEFIDGEEEPEGPRVVITDPGEEDLPVLLSVTTADLDAAPGDPGRKLEMLARRLQVVQKISQAASHSFEEETLLRLVMDELFAVLPQAERGFVLLWNGDARKEPRPVVVRNRHDPAEEISVSRTLLRAAIEGRQAILSTDALKDERFDSVRTIRELRIRSVVCVPMLKEEEVFGVIQVDSTRRSAIFSPADLELMLAIAGQVALALDNVRLHDRLVRQELLQRDLALATEIQRHFLPGEMPRIPGWDFAIEYAPALEVGGDFYDVPPLPGGRLAVTVGDVSGKGISAALYMANVASRLRYHSAGLIDPAAILQALDASLSEGRHGMFVTVAMLVLNPATGELWIANAGHPPPLLRRTDGTVVPLESARNPPLGTARNTRFETSRVLLREREVVILYTDGVTEARSPQGDLFGEDRFAKAVASSDGTPAGVLARVLTEVRQFVESEPPSDDLTLLCFGRASPARPPVRI